MSQQKLGTSHLSHVPWQPCSARSGYLVCLIMISLNRLRASDFHIFDSEFILGAERPLGGRHLAGSQGERQAD